MMRLKELRQNHGLSQKEFSKEIGAAQNTVSNWENGNRLMDINTATKIATYFGVSTDYLLGTELNDTNESKPIADEDIMFALFGGEKGITPEMYEEVKQFAEMVKLREKERKRKEHGAG